MKNKTMFKVVALVFLCIGSLNLRAQDSDKPAKAGIRAGWNYSAMFNDGDILRGTDHKNAFYLGVFKEKKVIPFLRFGSGLEYMNNGYKLSNNGERDIHYMSIPLYLKVKLGPLYATGGTGLNFKVAESLPESALLDPLNNEKTDFFDMPLQLGAGVKVLMFAIEARYNWGMFDVNDGVSNQYLQVGLTLSL